MDFGANGSFDCEVSSSRVVGTFTPPVEERLSAERISDRLTNPIDFPRLREAVLPDDRIVLALEPDTPSGAHIVAGIWIELEHRGVDPDHVVIVSPDRPDRSIKPTDPRSALPESVQQSVEWKIHDPAAKDSCAYLASSAGGERIYLCRDLIDADIVVPIGCVGFDPLLGLRGGGSILFPWLSNADAVTRARGQGHTELRPEDPRPLRQLVDEIVWLLGIQFTVQAVPSSRTGAALVLAGAIDSVYSQARQYVLDNWTVTIPERADVVVASVPTDAGGHGWSQIGEAIDAARRLVARGGRIVVLSELDADPSAGIAALRRAETPRDVLKPLRLDAPPDLIAATQIVNGLEWAGVYLLSGLASDRVEELFMTPLESPREVMRVIDRGGTCLFLQSAQHVHGCVREPA